MGGSGPQPYMWIEKQRTSAQRPPSVRPASKPICGLKNSGRPSGRPPDVRTRGRPSGRPCILQINIDKLIKRLIMEKLIKNTKRGLVIAAHAKEIQPQNERIGRTC